MRRCIYHERAIVEERVRLALGDGRSNCCTVKVKDIACDECPTRRFFGDVDKIESILAAI